MTKHDDAATGRATPASSKRARSLYALLFAVQTIGAVILLWYAVPHYQQVLADPGGHEARPETLIWSLSAVALMQAGYWIRHRLRPPLPQVRNAFVGYIILFVARMSFVLATSIFGFVFITRKPEFQIPIFRYVVTIAGLFALFCYTQELENLGKNLLEKENP
jgi:uncharacterized BrkB/YihY/UPF0761 family membrane protein